MPQTYLPSQAELDTVVTLHTKAGVLSLPYGYLWARPPLATLRAKPDQMWTQFKFAFWMPDGAYARWDALDQNLRDPRDDGKTPEKPGRYLVWVIEVHDAADPDVVPPYRRIGNVLSMDSRGIAVGRDGDLITVGFKGVAVPDFWYLSLYDKAAKASRSIFFSCLSAQFGSPRAPNCATTADIANGGLKVLLDMLVPQDRRTDAPAILAKTQDLLLGWRASAATPSRPTATKDDSSVDH